MRRAAPAAELRQCAGDGLVDADRQIASGGQRLGGRDDLVRLGIDHRRIGIGAAGVDAGEERRA